MIDRSDMMKVAKVVGLGAAATAAPKLLRRVPVVLKSIPTPVTGLVLAAAASLGVWKLVSWRRRRGETVSAKRIELS